MKGEGVDVYFYVPPSPPQALRHLQTRYADTISKIDAELLDLAPVLRIDIAYARRFAWQDAMHVCTEAGMRLLDALLIEIDAGESTGGIVVDGRV